MSGSVPRFSSIYILSQWLATFDRVGLPFVKLLIKYFFKLHISKYCMYSKILIKHVCISAILFLYFYITVYITRCNFFGDFVVFLWLFMTLFSVKSFLSRFLPFFFSLYSYLLVPFHKNTFNSFLSPSFPCLIFSSACRQKRLW